MPMMEEEGGDYDDRGRAGGRFGSRFVLSMRFSQAKNADSSTSA